MRAVEGFEGTVRRFELHGVERGVSVFDDYAHHPTEVAAALAAARTVVGDGRIIAIQQPHTYSRTQQMYREFAEVLERYADHTVDARRVRRARGSRARRDRRARLAARSPTPSHVHYVADWQEAADYTATVAREGDYVITLGCGNVYQIIPQVLDALSRTPDAASARRTKRRSSAGCAGRRLFRRPRTLRERGRRRASVGAEPRSTRRMPSASTPARPLATRRMPHPIRPSRRSSR